MSFSFPDYYPRSKMRVLEQCQDCGNSLFDQFKGCNMQMVLLGNEQNFKRGGSNIKGGICPLCINHCRIYDYCKICLDWQKSKHTDECTILNKFD